MAPHNTKLVGIMPCLHAIIPWKNLPLQEIVDYLKHFNYGWNTSTTHAKSLVLRRYLAPNADSSSTYVPYWSVIPTPEDICICSSKENLGAVTNTEATTKNL